MSALDCPACRPESHIECNCTKMCPEHRSDPAALRDRAEQVTLPTTRLRLLELAEAAEVRASTPQHGYPRKEQP